MKRKIIMLQPLLIEIGVEELPAIPLINELPNIEKKWAKVLEDNSLMSEFEFYYTPRRLVLWHSEFKTTQEDSVEEFFGAPVELAYKDGKATAAAEGFAKKCGVSIDEISSAQKGGKEVLYFKKEVAGKSSAHLLETMITEWINSLKFGKSMRWGSLSESFIRPIRWVNVMFGKESVDVELFGVKSQHVTYIHRMRSFDAQKVSSIESYFNILHDGAVRLYPEDRKIKILADFEDLQKSEDIFIEVDDNLLNEIIAITEFPTALMGSFDHKFLSLPPEVIITSMKEHQRYFPVFRDGKLLNRFVFVTNALTNDYSKVIEGNERVLRPRLSDALFFYKNDLKKGLKTDGLEKVIFMNGLGTLKDKIEREKKIAIELFSRYSDQVCISNALSCEENMISLQRAVDLAKADLMSEMVYEFTELQGLMGSYYAKALGESEDVVSAIKEQYLPAGEDSPLPSTPFNSIVAMSIKIDTLLGLFSINEIPTGSRDPFALRRAVNGIMRIVKDQKFDFDICATLKELSKNYNEFEFEKLENFILERIYQTYKVNPSLIKAVLNSGEREILKIDQKIEMLDNVVNSESFDTIFSTFKRVANISKDMDISQKFEIKSELLESSYEKELYESFSKIVATDYDSFEENLDALFSLKEKLDSFFDNVMVNAEDEKIKNNRKSLVASIYKEIFKIADIKEISI
jgi:glycyl-tRNA synthetase beta chain